MQQNITQDMRAEVEKLYARRAQADSKDWARRILARHIDGINIAPCTLLFAKQALKLDAN